MSISQQLVNPFVPLADLGVDASTAIGAQILALRLRRFWLSQSIDIPAEVYVVQSSVDEKGGPRSGRTIYSARLDMKAARKVDETQQWALIASVELEAAVFA